MGIFDSVGPNPTFTTIAAAFKYLKTFNYDLIIVDSPPVMPILGLELLSEIVDAIILVVRAGKTSRKMIKTAVNLLEGKNLIGIIFNDARRQLFGPFQYGFTHLSN